MVGDQHTAANELVGPLHDQMPTLLQCELYGLWLDPRTEPAVLKKLLRTISGVEDEESSRQVCR
jgi:putative SOS response-associated peptidase YedK